MCLQTQRKGNEWVIKWVIQKKMPQVVEFSCKVLSESFQKVSEFGTSHNSSNYIMLNKIIHFSFDKIISRYTSFSTGKIQLYFKHLSRSNLGKNVI